MIQLTSSTLEAAENFTTVRELPLNGRDWTTLAQLQPGITGVDQFPLGLNNQRANRGLGMQLSIGGIRPQGNNYRLDGISTNDYSNGGPGSVLGVLLGVEAVQEFSVVRNSAPASYGRTSGGVLNSITRSGTNELHGSAMSFCATAPLTLATSSTPLHLRPHSGAISSEPMLDGDYQKQVVYFCRLRRNSSAAFNNIGGHRAFCRRTYRTSNFRNC